MNIDYKQKYLKYKNKYLNSQKGGVVPPEFDEVDPLSSVDKIKTSAHESAYKFIREMIRISTESNYEIDLQVATSESLTAGLVFSTLVDIPLGGRYKYGCFGVYDTDAKRMFIGVNEPDVYTHNCAKQMAVGTLLNSNATFSIAVTGNAMAVKNDEHKIGEVFIGIACYVDDGGVTKIKVHTAVHNFCRGNPTCKLWYETPLVAKKLTKALENVVSNEAELENIVEPAGASFLSRKPRNDFLSEPTFNTITNQFNDFQLTSIVAQIIRYSTVHYALEEAITFIATTPNIITPAFVAHDRLEKGLHQKTSDIDISKPNNKYSHKENIPIICENANCEDNTRMGIHNFALYDKPHHEKMSMTEI